MADKQVALGAMLFEGKAKQTFAAPNKDLVIIHYKDDASAFHGEKKGRIEGKGIINNKLSASFFRLVEAAGVPTHFVTRINDRDQLCRNVKIIPLKIIIRNAAAGTYAERTGLAEGTQFDEPVLELSCKGSAEDETYISGEQAVSKGLLKAEEVELITEMAYQVNDVIEPYLLEKGLKLIDCKLEFGRNEDGQIILADEISPDTCRIWDSKTNEKLGLDRFRLDMGNIIEAYNKVWEQVGDFRVTE